MPHPLDGCRAKLERVDELLYELAPKVEQLCEWYTPEKCSRHFDEETRQQIVKVPPALRSRCGGGSSPGK